MPGKPRYKLEEVITACQNSGGIVSVACKRLGCSWDCLDNYRKKHSQVAEALRLAREETLDFTESQLISLVREKNIVAILFFLKTQGKARGWIERQEVAGPDGKPSTIILEWPADEAEDRTAGVEVEEIFPKRAANEG